MGLSVMLYPTVSDWWNKRVSTKAIKNYDAIVEEIDEADYTAYFEAAEAYNESIVIIGSSDTIVAPELLENYEDTLDVTGTGIIGYVTIEKINVNLPIYHSTSSAALQAGAGHLEGTSLPIGGESMHSVIVGHRGLPSAKLFTDLDQMEVGDMFTITVLDQVYTYEVDQISIVLPTEIEELYVVDGKDYCTLMTCTPYGVNSHRLLVRGVRVDNTESGILYVTAEAYQIDVIIVVTMTAVPLLLLLLIGLLIFTRRQKKK